jgi:branched-subunit amino acid aminotransferase/4-amino-4-deoxychorismate lyase
MASEDAPLLVADSWLVLDGSVRTLDRHVSRFSRSCLELGGVTQEELDRFWRRTISALPRTGAWFPRVELAGDPPSLRLRIRPAPPRGEHVRVWVPGTPDRRGSPTRKGPDLQSLTRLRSEAEEHDAQEALLRTADGVVVEAASSSVLWWEDDVLCSPPEEIPALPGTTAGLVRDLAAAQGIPTARCVRRVDELAGREVWLLNALHGIRLVTAWIGCDATPGRGRHFARWRERVERLRLPLDPPSRHVSSASSVAADPSGC